MGNKQNGENIKESTKISRISKILNYIKLKNIITIGEHTIESHSNNNTNNRYSVEDRNSSKLNSPEGRVIIYGFLKKRSKYIHLWKTRFFILTNHYIFAFTGVENDADCTMAIELSTIKEVTEVESKKEGKKAFMIRTDAHNYFLRAENDNIMNKWKDEINKLLNTIKKDINEK